VVDILDNAANLAGDGSTLAAVLEKKSEKIGFEVIEEERIPGSRVRFKVKVADSDFEARMEETLRELSRQVRVPGFRPGKAPKNLLRRSYEPVAREETVKRMIPRLAQLFSEERNLEPLTQPYLLTWKSDATNGTTVELALEVHPDIQLTDESLAGVAVEAHKIRLDEDYIESRVEKLRGENATFVPTEEGYQSKDGLLFTCEVSGPGGYRIAERCAKDYYSTRIEDEMPEQVAAALVGKKKGERISLQVEEVSEVNPNINDIVHYEVEIHEVKRRVLPTLDDEFAKDVNDKFATVEELRKGLREDLTRQEEDRQREEALMEVYGVLRDRLNFDLPRALVDSTAQRSVYDMEKRLNQYGMSLRDMGETVIQNYAASMREQARVNVKNHLIMRAVSRYLAVKPTEADIAAELQKIADRAGRKPLAVRAQLEAKKQWEPFIADLVLRLTNDAVLSRGTVTYKDTTISEFEEIQRKRQEDQAARLRGQAEKAHDHAHGHDHAHDHDHDHDHLPMETLPDAPVIGDPENDDQ